MIKYLIYIVLTTPVLGDEVGYTHPCDTDLAGNSSLCQELAEKRNIGIALLEPNLDIDLDRTVDIEGISNFISSIPGQATDAVASVPIELFNSYKNFAKGVRRGFDDIVGKLNLGPLGQLTQLGQLGSGYQTKRNVLEPEKIKGDDPFSPYSSNYIGELQYNKNSPSYVTPSPGLSLAQLLPSINLKSSTVSSGPTPKPFRPFSSVISKFKSGFSTPKPNSFSSQKYSDQNGNFNLNLNGNKGFSQVTTPAYSLSSYWRNDNSKEFGEKIFDEFPVNLIPAEAAQHNVPPLPSPTQYPTPIHYPLPTQYTTPYPSPTPYPYPTPTPTPTYIIYTSPALSQTYPSVTQPTSPGVDYNRISGTNHIDSLGTLFQNYETSTQSVVTQVESTAQSLEVSEEVFDESTHNYGIQESGDNYGIQESADNYGIQESADNLVDDYEATESNDEENELDDVVWPVKPFKPYNPISNQPTNTFKPYNQKPKLSLVPYPDFLSPISSTSTSPTTTVSRRPGVSKMDSKPKLDYNVYNTNYNYVDSGSGSGVPAPGSGYNPPSTENNGYNSNSYQPQNIYKNQYPGQGESSLDRKNQYPQPYLRAPVFKKGEQKNKKNKYSQLEGLNYKKYKGGKPNQSSPHKSSQTFQNILQNVGGRRFDAVAVDSGERRDTEQWDGYWETNPAYSFRKPPGARSRGHTFSKEKMNRKTGNQKKDDIYYQSRRSQEILEEQRIRSNEEPYFQDVRTENPKIKDESYNSRERNKEESTKMNSQAYRRALMNYDSRKQRRQTQSKEKD